MQCFSHTWESTAEWIFGSSCYTEAFYLWPRETESIGSIVLVPDMKDDMMTEDFCVCVCVCKKVRGTHSNIIHSEVKNAGFPLKHSKTETNWINHRWWLSSSICRDLLLSAGCSYTLNHLLCLGGFFLDVKDDLTSLLPRSSDTDALGWRESTLKPTC